MSLWTKFLDWLLGREIMSIEDLKAIEDETLTQLEDMFDDLNSRIDTDADGMVSIREAWTLFKEILSIVKSSIKRLFK